MVVIVFPLVLLSIISQSNAEIISSNESTEAELEWSQANYKVTNGTGAVKVIVTDPDMNIFSNNIDTLKVFVFSDSDREGITLTLYETEKDNGVFERTFTFSDKRSAPSVLYALEGDTVAAQYVDTTLPADVEFGSIKMTKTMFLGLTGPPLERVPAELLRVENLQGDDIGKIPTILLDQQVKIVADITNQMDRDQDFAYIVQILDEKKSVVSVSWLTGSLTPMQTFSSAQSWTPQNTGKYSATVFVWESVNNPTALSPPLSIEIIVKDVDL